MRPDDGSVRLPRLTAGAVLVISAALVVVEAWRIGELEPARDLVVAIIASAIFFPLHARHLHYGLRGERPPNSLPTLAVVAAANLAALLLIGPAWSFMLGALATSALIVPPLRWTLVAAMLCALGPALGEAVHPGEAAGNGATGGEPAAPRAVIGRVARRCARVACCRDTDSYGLDRDTSGRTRSSVIVLRL